MSDDFLVHYSEHCFGKGDLLYGAFVDGKMSAPRNCAPTRRSERTGAVGRNIHAEAAFWVEGYRRRGIGEKLFQRIMRAATNHGVETIEIVCVPDNVSMRRLAQKFKAHFTFEENATGALTARWPTAFSMMREISRDALDFGAAMFDAHWRAVTGARDKSG